MAGRWRPANGRNDLSGLRRLSRSGPDDRPGGVRRRRQQKHSGGRKHGGGRDRRSAGQCRPRHGELFSRAAGARGARAHVRSIGRFSAARDAGCGGERCLLAAAVGSRPRCVGPNHPAQFQAIHDRGRHAAELQRRAPARWTRIRARHLGADLVPPAARTRQHAAARSHDVVGSAVDRPPSRRRWHSAGTRRRSRLSPVPSTASIPDSVTPARRGSGA